MKTRRPVPLVASLLLLGSVVLVWPTGALAQTSATGTGGGA